MPTNDDQFVVLGDLGQGKYIVRMLINDHVIDEEFTATSTQELVAQIEGRMGKLAKGDYKRGALHEGQFKFDGQAIPLTPEQGA